MKIVIIGCGYVGKAIAQVWTQAGHEVTATTTTPEKVADLERLATGVMVVKGDNPEALKEAIADQEVILLSVAAKSRSVDGYRETYLNTAKNLVSALEENRTVQQVIYTGSYGVLGSKQGQWIDETASVTPINEHGDILLQTEQVLLSGLQEPLKLCILRLAGIYGPRRELIKIFGSWAGTTRPGTGEDYTNWVHLDDIVGALKLIQQQQLEGIYHLADDSPMPKKEFYRRLFESHGLPALSWNSSQSSERVYNLRLSNQKLKRAGLNLVHPETEF
ncbi:NAD-dependent epimerase/dehydratase [Gloeothece citriformis PCC 7424]|uniref:NAD-dependent epimerase/dehydratase n=1 Tax=Gloeothece citriformis (strain PCC 7424) TaxID=65393 RepID=B7KJU9_GLOC7|nr:SDR family oxidoreductase [Gloeothece citriformis]ACK69548.1 NAD-dependent epimerase/dehydratase [Gloeothece citriformis PCC 7424]